ncbi:aldehyde dehydrogenase family protein [Pseudomonas moorei]|uniref:aldehyde dehydrogenase family protein n=1 Tax=Pseudomonas moorei TaxID=395599 RepID=UPI001FF642E6|nr:aldehyde dehydrogenase family protein [Pseudomonas moorei]
MKLTGNLLIGAHEIPATEGTLKALNPATNQFIEPDFALGGVAQVDQAAILADEAFDAYSHTSLAERSAFLERIADNLDAASTALAARASLETGLPEAQLQGEAAKAATQFRQFAAVVRKGRFLQLAIDPAQPERQPRPRMDHRLQKIAIGPVAIFGASNFPISYSVAGGDTASAQAAGATVVLKAHNAHPGASEILARAIRQAVQDSGLPEGVFSMVRGSGNAIGEALVDHGDLDGQSALLEVDGQRFLSETALAHEVFGPAALLVKVRDEAEMRAVARALRGQLSAAMHLEAGDLGLAQRLLPVLERRTGRIVVNAFAHPQEVSFATIHGGPFPASSDSRFTSVGMTSIERFLRPVSYQGFPDALLPEALRDGNPLGVPRSVDGL